MKDSFDLNDPNLLIDDITAEALANKAQIEVKTSSYIEVQRIPYMEIDFQQTGDSFYLEPSVCGKKFNIAHNSSNQVPFWILDSDPYRWHFIPKDAIVNPRPLEDDWDFTYIIRVLGQWGSTLYPGTSVAGQYRALSLMLLFNHAPLTIAQKDTLRPFFEAYLKHTEPYFDLAEADLSFCRKIYQYNPIARRAKSEEHLWLCLQYSWFLHLSTPTRQSKTNVRKGNSDFCQAILESLDRISLSKKFPNIKVVLPEDYTNLKPSWHFNIRDLLIGTTLQLLKEKPSLQLKLQHSLKHWIEATRHWNRIVGFEEGYDTLKPPKATQPKKRRGRPPKFL